MSFGGFFKGLGKFALKAAPIATMFIPGLQPLGAALLGAGAGAGSGLASGKGLKGAALGAGLGAIPGAVSGIKGLPSIAGGATKAGVNLPPVNANAIAGVKDVATKGLGGKLLDSLTSPEIIKAGIGAGLTGIFDDEGDKRKSFKGRNSPETMLTNARKGIGAGGLARINLLQNSFKNPGVAPINFQTQVPGLPFQISQQNAGIQATQPRQGPDPLDELRKILAGLA